MSAVILGLAPWAAPKCRPSKSGFFRPSLNFEATSDQELLWMAHICRDRRLWFLKTFCAKATLSASHSKVEISDVTLGSADGRQANKPTNKKMQVVDEQQSGEEDNGGAARPAEERNEFCFRQQIELWSADPPAIVRQQHERRAVRAAGSRVNRRGRFLFPRSPLLFFAFFCVVPMQAQANGDMDKYSKHGMQVRSVPGLAFAVTENDRIIKEGAYGLANVETGSPVERVSVFEIASVTKP